MKKRTLLGLLALVPMVWLSGCGGGSGGNASVRLVNASSGYDKLDLYVNDVIQQTAIATGAAGDFASVSSGTVTTALAATTSSTYLLSQSRNFGKDTKYSVVAYGWQGGLRSVVLTENIAAADANKTKVAILNTATDAGSLDIYLTGDSDLLSASTPVAQAITGGSQSSYAAVVSGTYRLRVTATGNTNDVRLDAHGVVLGSTEVDTLVLSAGAGGLLINASQVVQGGSVTAYNNTQARVRVVSALTGTGDKTTVNVNGTALVVGAPSPAISSYTALPAGAAAITGTTTGSTTLTAGSDTTLLMAGTAANPTLYVLADDNRLPTSTTGVKLRLVNAMDPTSMAAYPLTMTLDYSPVASNVAPGTQSTYAVLPSTTTSILEVSSALQAATMFSPTGTLSNLTLSAQGVYTVFMFGNATTWSGSLRKER
jgi:hypothetical protein